MAANSHFVLVNDNDTPIGAAARLEAMMTFKQRQLGSQDSEYVFLNPRIVKSKEQTFNFGRIFQSTLCDLASGKRTLPREIDELFA
jgi:hypothetical protein